MKISYHWIKQFINTTWSAEETAQLLTNLGLEVESIHPYQSVKGGLKNVVVGEVLSCEKHPNADKLKITTVNIGNETILQIVCGASNVAVGQKVPVATIGTILYNEAGESWTITKSKIRDIESFGMICAEDELGLGKSHEGIMVLDADIPVGTPCAEVFEVFNDEVFEIGLTPNRADAMSHFGTARDLKAGLMHNNINLDFRMPSVSNFHIDNRTLKIDVQVNDKHLAPRYCGITISNIEVKPSPTWLQHQLKAIGLSPINNIVDITNYVLHELGQPLHAFDANKISGHKIEVKTLPTGTKFLTLDGVERTLNQEDLMICDALKPMCIAGVYGGLHSGVSENTKNIFLESAYFNPVSIRKSAKRHGLNTDASFRFERGIDPNITEYALKRAALLIIEIAGGDISSDIIDLYPTKIEDFIIPFNFENARKLIGADIPRETIIEILASLEFKINNISSIGLGLIVPAYRNDVQREADVIEEILRVYGYNNIKISERLNASISPSSRFEDYKIQNIVGNQLASLGYFEMLTNSLTTPNYNTIIPTNVKHNPVSIINPLSADLSVMRTSLLCSGLEAVAFNINRKRNDLKLFEFGKTYEVNDAKYQENKLLGLFITGNKNFEQWNTTTQKTDFFYLKAHVETVLERIGISKFKTEPYKATFFREGLCLSVGNQIIVEFGLIQKNILKHFAISQDVYYAQFQWDVILGLLKHNKIAFKAIPKYPEVRRDFALLLNQDVTFEAIYKIAMKTEKQLLKQVNLFDVYQGKNLPEGKKSYAVSFIIQDENKTLTDAQIDAIMSSLKSNFEKQLGAELR